MATKKATVEVSAEASQNISGTIPLDVVKAYERCVKSRTVGSMERYARFDYPKPPPSCMMKVVHAILESKDYDETEWDYDDLSPEGVSFE